MGTTVYAENKSLGEINLAMPIALGALVPLLPQIDLALFGIFGLGPMALDFQARLDAALSITVVRPDVWVTGQLKAMADIIAGITAGAILPGIAANVNIGLAADLQAKLFGINAVIDLTLGLKDAALGAQASLEGALGASVGYMVWHGPTADFDAEVPGQLKTLAAGNGGGAGDTYMIALMFGSEAAFNAAASMFLTM